MNEHITIEELERAATGSPTLAMDLRTAIHLHLQGCPECREAFESVRAFYRRIVKPPSEALDSSVTELLCRINESPRALTIPLYPRGDSIGDGIPTPKNYSLAAQSLELAVRYSPEGTLTSMDERILLRITHDRTLGTFLCQLLSDDPTQIAEVLVTFNDIPGAFVTTESGEFHLIPGKTLDVHHLSALVHLPLCAVDISSDIADKISQGTSATISGAAGYQIKIVPLREEECEFRLTEGEGSVQGILVFSGDSEHHTLEEGFVRMKRNAIQSGRRFTIYA